MNKQIKNLFFIAIICLSVLVSACSGYSFKAPKDNPSASDAVENNGGLAVKKGDYLYFVNGVGSAASDNKYGTPIVGSLYRVKLDADDNIVENSTALIVPKIVLSNASGVNDAKNYGIFIVGEYIYFGSPSLEKDKNGDTLTSYLDLFRCKLNGTGMKKLYTLTSSSYQGKFIEDNGEAYYIYVEEGTVYQINQNGKRTKLVEDITTSIVFGDDNHIYYNRAVAKDNDKKGTDEEEYENYSEVYKTNLITGEETVVIDKNNAIINESRDKQYTLTLVGSVNGILYYDKTVETIGKNFALVDGAEVKLPSDDTLSGIYYLGFDNKTNKTVIASYLGKLVEFSFDSNNQIQTRIIMEVAPTSILKLDAENQIVYYMEESILYSYDYSNLDTLILSKTILDISFNTTNWFPKIYGNYLYFMSESGDFVGYMYRMSLIPEYDEEDTKFLSNKVEPQLIGALTEEDQVIWDEIQEEKAKEEAKNEEND